jgi:hypothetical protein
MQTPLAALAYAPCKVLVSTVFIHIAWKVFLPGEKGVWGERNKWEGGKGQVQPWGFEQ